MKQQLRQQQLAELGGSFSAPGVGAMSVRPPTISQDSVVVGRTCASQPELSQQAIHLFRQLPAAL